MARVSIGSRWIFDNGRGQVDEYVIPEIAVIEGRETPGMEVANPGPKNAVYPRNTRTGGFARIYAGTLMGVSPWSGRGEWKAA